MTASSTISADPHPDPGRDDHPRTPGRSGPPVSTWTKSSSRMFGEGLNVDLLEGLLLAHAGLGDAADLEPGRVGGGDPPVRPAGGDEDLALLDLLLVGDEVEEQILGIAHLRLDDAVGPVGKQAGRDRAAVVGDERHLGAAAGRLGDAADEPVAVHDRVVHVHAGAPADVDRHRRVPDGRRAADDPAGDPLEGGERSRSGLSSSEQLAELLVLADGLLRVGDLLAKLG